MKENNERFIGLGDNGFKVMLNTSNFYDNDKIKLQDAAQWMAEALGSKEFQDFCIHFGYDLKACSGRWWWKTCSIHHYSEFEDNDNYSNEEIYDLLMTGKETLSSEGKDGEADIFLELDRRSNRKVLGYTYATTTTQWIYNNFFHNGSVGDIAGNLTHEWCHKMGFTHTYRFTPSRPYSVPYAIGYFVRDYVEKKLTQEQIAV